MTNLRYDDLEIAKCLMSIILRERSKELGEIL